MIGRKGLLAIAVAIAVSALCSASLQAAECAGVQFPDSDKVGSTDLVLNGMGIRKATMFNVEVYVAGLYLPQKSTDGQKIAAANQPWKLVLQFVHDVDASDIKDAFEDGFEKAAGDKFDSMKAQIADLESRMVDFNEGHTLSYAYDPATGTIVDVNGSTGAAIEGADFAAALLTISIGPNPPNEELRDGLLGATCE